MRRLALTSGLPTLPCALPCVLAFALVLAPRQASGAGDDAGAPHAVLTCEHADGPGRVRCEVEATAAPGGSITWGDVVLLQTPPFASALRGRIGPREATVHRPDAWRWALALVVRGKGSGDIEGRVRLVVCRGGAAGKPDQAETCGPQEIPVVGHLVVGE